VKRPASIRRPPLPGTRSRRSTPSPQQRVRRTSGRIALYPARRIRCGGTHAVGRDGGRLGAVCVDRWPKWGHATARASLWWWQRSLSGIRLQIQGHLDSRWIAIHTERAARIAPAMAKNCGTDAPIVDERSRLRFRAIANWSLTARRWTITVS